MDTRKIERWAQLLLDTGKRNNLINFKDSKSSTVEVVCPDVETFFSKCTVGEASFEIYNPNIIDEDENELVSSVNPTDEIESEENNRLKKEEYISKYGPRIRKTNQVLVYAKTPNPITAVKHIHKRAKAFMEETGVNVAHIAFGFIHWKESESSQLILRAPILLIPISFRNDSSISPFYIDTSDEDVIVNPTFSYLLSSQYGITLPEYLDEDLSIYLEKIERIVSNYI